MALCRCRGCRKIFETPNCSIYCSEQCRIAYTQKDSKGAVHYEQRPCAKCGKPFKPKSKNSRFCSPKCGIAHRALLKSEGVAWQGVCEICGSACSTGRRFCKEHSEAGRRKRIRQCVVCETPFSTTYPRKITCSPVCSTKHNMIQEREKRRNAAIPRKQQPFPEYPARNCPQCGQEFRKRPSTAFCSSRCKMAAAREQAFGKRDGAFDEYLNKKVKAARKRAREQRIPFDLHWRDLHVPDTCPILGTPIIKGGDLNDLPSLDKIVPTLGYVRGNVQIVSNRANRLKSDATIEELRAILAYMEKYNRVG